jgi:hypothetical protein
MPKFTARTIQLEELFANPFLIDAPSYQRAFVWGAKEAGQLFDDVTGALAVATAGRDDGDYCFGAMVFVARPAGRLARWKSGQLLDVVDGFQRLTTLTILFCVLRDLSEASGQRVDPRLLAAIRVAQGARYRLSLGVAGEGEENFFERHVRAPGATGVTPATAGGSGSEKHILAVRDLFIGELKDYDAKARTQFADFLLARCCVVFVTTSDIDRAHHVFEVLNARGRPLARNEILKAILLGGVAKPAAEGCHAIWKDAERRLGEEFESLFSHIWSMHGRPEGRIIAGILKISDARGGPQAFIEQLLRPAAAIFEVIRNAKDSRQQHAAGTAAQYLRYLGWHSFSDWMPPAMLWWLNSKSEDSEGFARFLARLDRLAFGVRILGIGANKRATRFGLVAAAIRRGERLDAADSPLALSRQELRTIQHHLADLHVRNAVAAKHLLLRLGDRLAGTPQSSMLPADMTVEHVLPRRLGTDSPWRPLYPDPEEREDCTESLGNLVLVTKAQNDRAGNLDFARKLEVYFNTPNAPIPAINEDVRGCTEWGSAQIKQREVKLLRLIKELWDFDPAPPRDASQEGRGDRRRGRKRPPGADEQRDRAP